jgi:uncharacterized protein YbaR (Trm112 family)
MQVDSVEQGKEPEFIDVLICRFCKYHYKIIQINYEVSG